MRAKVLVGVALVAAIALAAWWIAGPGPGAPDTSGLRGPAARDPGEPASEALAARGGATAPKPPARRQPLPVPDGPVLRGRVVDGAGTGIAGASVLAIPDTTGATALPEAAGAEGGIGAENFTGDDGRFVVAAAGNAPFFSLVAHAGGYAPASVSEVRPGTDTTIVLGAGSALSGRVLTLDGDPVVGGTVRACALVDAVRFEREAVSGEDGRYRVERLPDAGTAYAPGTGQRCLIVSAEGFAPLHLGELGRWGRSVPGRADEFAMDLVLVRGATLVGKVVDDESGAGIEDARVVLWSIESLMGSRRASGVTMRYPWSPRLLAETRSGPDGTFRFAHVPANGFHPIQSHNMGARGTTLGGVGAWKPGYAWAEDEVPVAADGAALSAQVRLRPSAVLAGRVLAADGGPAARATLWAESESGAWRGGYVPAFLVGEIPGANATADAQGRYRIEAAPASALQAVRVKVSAAQPQSTEVRWREPARASVVVEARAGAATEVPDIRLGAAPAAGWPQIVLVVVDEQGAPVWGAQPSSLTGEFTLAPGRTDRDGRLTLAVPRGRSAASPPPAVVRAKGYAPAPLPWPASPVEGQEVRVVLRAAHRVAGRVVRDDGTPAVEARVTVFDGAAPLADLLPRPGPSGAPGGAPVPAVPRGRAALPLGWAATGPDGAFAVGDLPEGPFHVLARDATRARGAPLPPATASGVPADTADLLLTLPLPPPSTGGRILVTVLDALTRRPVGLAEVGVTRRRGPDEAPAGVRFVDAGDGTFFVPYGAEDPRAAKVAPGQFEVSDAPHGVYDLEVRAHGFAPARVEGVAVAGGEVSVPPVALSRGARLHGRLRLPEGANTKDYTLQFSPLGAVAPLAGAWAAVGPDGTYSASGLLPGAYRLRFLPTGLWLDSRPPPTYVRDADVPVEVPEGASDLEVDLTLVAAGRLRVEVFDARLPPAQFPTGAGATPDQTAFGRGSSLVVAAQGGREVARADSLERGIPLDLSRLTVLPGTYLVTFSPLGGPPQTATVTVAAGEEAPATIGTRPARR